MLGLSSGPVRLEIKGQALSHTVVGHRLGTSIGQPIEYRSDTTTPPTTMLAIRSARGARMWEWRKGDGVGSYDLKGYIDEDGNPVLRSTTVRSGHHPLVTTGRSPQAMEV